MIARSEFAGCPDARWLEWPVDALLRWLLPSVGSSGTLTQGIFKVLDLIHWHSLDASPLNESSVVVDLGANAGEFATKMNDRFGVRVIAVEPNPALYARLCKLPYVTAFQAAISSRDGTARFVIDENDLASRIGQADDTGIEVETITLSSLMQRAGIQHIDLLKIDIEGAEIDLLMTAPDELLKGIRQITLELHDFCGFVAQEDVAKVVLRMKSLGFHVARMSRVGHQDTWIGNQLFRRIGLTERAHIGVLKYSRGLRRVFRKVTRGSRWAEGM
jgi:FkbM family methyltransferase